MWFSKFFHNLAKFPAIFAQFYAILQNLPQLAKFSAILQNCMRSCKIFHNLAKFSAFLHNLMRSCKIFYNLAKFPAILQSFIWFCQIFHNFAKFIKKFRELANLLGFCAIYGFFLTDTGPHNHYHQQQHSHTHHHHHINHSPSKYTCAKGVSIEHKAVINYYCPLSLQHLLLFSIGICVRMMS